MSFILDALKKSESDRQQQTGAEFSDVPSGSGDSRRYKWLWILALLLVVNFAALLVVLVRPGSAPQDPAPVVAPPAGPAASQPAEPAQPSFEEQVAIARETHEARAEVRAETAELRVRDTQAEEAASAPPAPATRRIRTIDELRLEGSLQLEDLHLDIHVFSDNRDERFVFINMAKHREGSRLDEGPVVSEITPDGVILDYQGMTFLLPRE